jgi:hypothetical protein
MRAPPAARRIKRRPKAKGRQCRDDTLLRAEVDLAWSYMQRVAGIRGPLISECLAKREGVAFEVAGLFEDLANRCLDISEGITRARQGKRLLMKDKQAKRG